MRLTETTFGNTKQANRVLGPGRTFDTNTIADWVTALGPGYIAQELYKSDSTWYEKDHSKAFGSGSDRSVSGVYVPDFRVRRVKVGAYALSGAQALQFVLQFDLPNALNVSENLLSGTDHERWITKVYLDIASSLTTATWIQLIG
jgi:hypothetical protein